MPVPGYVPNSYGPRRLRARPPTKTTRYGRWISAGDSWAGPARGPGACGKALRPPFQPGNRASVGRPQPDDAALQERRERIAQLYALLYWLMLNAQRQETRLTAA